MNILLTNDDGINSEGIQKLAKALRAVGVESGANPEKSAGKHRVYIIAPDSNRSGVSHGIRILHEPVKLTAIKEDTWSCSGTPADCIIVGLKGALSVKPDLVLSGINQGENTGTDIIYSGTAAAARQGSLSGIPALALSLKGNGPYYWDMAISWIIKHLEELIAFWRKDIFVNVNIPNTEGGPEGMVMVRPAIKCYNDNIEFMTAPDGDRWCFQISWPESVLFGENTDCDAVSRNLVSVSCIYNHPLIGE